MHVDFLDFGGTSISLKMHRQNKATETNGASRTLAPENNTNNVGVTQTTINDTITLDTFLGREEKPDIRIM